MQKKKKLSDDVSRVTSVTDSSPFKQPWTKQQFKNCDIRK